MIGRKYSIVFPPTSIAAAITDLLQLTPATNKVICIKGYRFNQVGVADMTDAQDETLGYTVIRGHTATGSGGTTPTPRPMGPSDTAAGFAAQANNTTIASSGTTVTLDSGGFNVRAQDIFWYPDGYEPVASAANTTLLIRLSAPTDAIIITGTVYVEEVG